MTDKSFTFNWYEEPEQGWLKFLYISLITGIDFKHLQTKTDKGNSITLQVFANGVELKAKGMMDSLEKNFEYHVQQEVKELTERIRLEDLENSIRVIEKSIHKEVERRFNEIGIDTEQYREDW